MFGVQIIDGVHIRGEQISLLRQREEPISMEMGLTLPYWSRGRRHYTMSLGLLRFHLSSDLNLTSKTFSFLPTSRAALLFTLAGFFSVPPSTVNISFFFFFPPLPLTLLLFFRLRSVSQVYSLSDKDNFLYRRFPPRPGGVWDVTARAGLGWNWFLGQIPPLPGDGWRDAPRSRWAAKPRHLLCLFILLYYSFIFLLKPGLCSLKPS